MRALGKAAAIAQTIINIAVDTMSLPHALAVSTAGDGSSLRIAGTGTGQSASGASAQRIV
ncbi:hypothetical protein AXE65_12225 [Ventosimonas gracilis]|uniref:Uncharacterized protein n=1 Tax=Ventosimonas gracilis TaxID=1680762 RepID=A0A139SWA9_9GAMM|nr:hypothetical protein AXE65_12225 [Ventosimonas gracilis]